MNIDLVDQAKELFGGRKPEHFTNYTHCEECLEHDQTLLNSDIESIGLDELGNPGWNPLCFSSPEGIRYYMPALVRLSLETAFDEFYFDQLLFHLEGDGPNNALVTSCSAQQREFVANFIKHMIENYPEQLESNRCVEEALKSYEIWAAP